MHQLTLIPSTIVGGSILAVLPVAASHLESDTNPKEATIRPGIATIVTVLLLLGTLALSPPTWAVVVLAVFALETAAVDVARARQARAHRT